MSETVERWIQLPDVVFRDDFDDDSVLFHPETDKAFRINSTGALVWKSLERGASVEEVIEDVRMSTTGEHSSLEEDVRSFMKLLQQHSLIGRVSHVDF